MQIIELKNLPENNHDEKLTLAYIQFQHLLNELSKKPLPDIIVATINQDISELNVLTTTEGLKQKQKNILKLLEKQLKIVPKNYYRNLWFVLGMSVFGLPIGVAIALSVHNMGLLGTGFPLGMFIGMLVGAGMDKKALTEGRQLDLEVK